MQFGDALDVMLAGGHVARNGWPSGEHLTATFTFSAGAEDKADSIEIQHNRGAVIAPWTGTEDDHAADDWVSVGSTNPLAHPDPSQDIESVGRPMVKETDEAARRVDGDPFH